MAYRYTHGPPRYFLALVTIGVCAFLNRVALSLLKQPMQSFGPSHLVMLGNKIHFTSIHHIILMIMVCMCHLYFLVFPQLFAPCAPSKYYLIPMYACTLFIAWIFCSAPIYLHESKCPK
jgi:hypothetical protein